MNDTVARTQMEYRKYRELVYFNLFDVEERLIQLAEEGKVWMVQEMKDLTMIEKVLITYLLCEKRELQVYDYVHPSL